LIWQVLASSFIKYFGISEDFAMLIIHPGLGGSSSNALKSRLKASGSSLLISLNGTSFIIKNHEV
jgi:hypothetical protein